MRKFDLSIMTDWASSGSELEIFGRSKDAPMDEAEEMRDNFPEALGWRLVTRSKQY